MFLYFPVPYYIPCFIMSINFSFDKTDEMTETVQISGKYIYFYIYTKNKRDDKRKKKTENLYSKTREKQAQKHIPIPFSNVKRWG